MGKIVEATGVAATSVLNKDLAASIERAMVEAVTSATAEGITDPTVIRQRMLEARGVVLAQAARVQTKGA